MTELFCREGERSEKMSLESERVRKKFRKQHTLYHQRKKKERKEKYV